MSEQEKTILILEDEPFVLHSLEHFLSHKPHILVRGFATLGEAKASLAQIQPSLVISDIGLPDGSGLELLPILDSMSPKPGILFVTGFYDRYQADIPSSHQVRTLQKPVSLQTIWEEGKRLMDEEGTDFNFKLTEYLQLACIGMHSVRIVWNPFGEILIKQGQLWSAKDRGGLGEPALKRMIVRSEIYGAGGQMNCKRVLDGQTGPRNIFASLENLMLNAVFEVEEAERENGRPHENDFDQVYKQARESLLERDYPMALAIFYRALKLDPNHSAVLANINRLEEMGVQPAEPTSEDV
ncbi:MAG: response regulator [Acidobacteria bacterium]|nr:response regulator [Acidobacteriota bacterium]